MEQNRIFLFAAAAVGWIGIGVWRSGTFFGAVAFLVGACLLFTAAARIGRQEVSKNHAPAPARKKEPLRYSNIVETQGWAVQPELDETTIRTLHAGEQTLLHMRRIAENVEDEIIVRLIGELCQIGEAMFTKIRRHPERLSSVQRFFRLSPARNGTHTGQISGLYIQRYL